MRPEEGSDEDLTAISDNFPCHVAPSAPGGRGQLRSSAGATRACPGLACDLSFQLCARSPGGLLNPLGLLVTLFPGVSRTEGVGFRESQVPLQRCPRFHRRQLWKQKEIMCYWEGTRGGKEVSRKSQHGGFLCLVSDNMAPRAAEVRAEKTRGRAKAPTACRVRDLGTSASFWSSDSTARPCRMVLGLQTAQPLPGLEEALCRLPEALRGGGCPVRAGSSLRTAGGSRGSRPPCFLQTMALGSASLTHEGHEHRNNLMIQGPEILPSAQRPPPLTRNLSPLLT